MLAKESSTRFDIPEELLEVLPSDPFEQLDVTRKITSIALSTRVDALEAELSILRQELTDRDSIISGLESQLEDLDASLNEASDKLAVAQQEKESLMRENAQLSSTVKKLNRDVTKLEAFRKTLMRSLQEDEDNPASAPKAASPLPPSNHGKTEQVVGLGIRAMAMLWSLTGRGVPVRQPHSPLLSPSMSTTPFFHKMLFYHQTKQLQCKANSQILDTQMPETLRLKL